MEEVLWGTRNILKQGFNNSFFVNVLLKFSTKYSFRSNSTVLYLNVVCLAYILFCNISVMFWVFLEIDHVIFSFLWFKYRLNGKARH